MCTHNPNDLYARGSAMTESEPMAERCVIKLTELHPFNCITYVYRVCFVAFLFCIGFVCVCF